MASSSPPETLAEALQRARIRLALSRPFLASAVLRLPLVAVDNGDWCPTAATDGYHVFYNPEWIGRLDAGSLRGLLAHEVLHVVFAHGERRQHRDHKRWNIACDHAINLLLLEQGFRLPRDGFADLSFRGLSAEQIYQRLPAQPLPERVFLPSAGQSDGSLVPEVGLDLVDPNHPLVSPLRTADAPDEERLREIRAELLADAAAQLQGAGSQQLLAEMTALQRRRVDWRALLQGWLTDRLKCDWSTLPFSKKHLHRGLFLPSFGVEAPGDIVFAIDTSGSMKSATLSRLVAELRAFRETFPCRLTVVQADAAVSRVTVFEALDGTEIPARMQLLGRGGTDFRPVFEWVRQNAPGAAVLYATDGHGTFPSIPPPNAVLWLLTAGHLPRERIPFGMIAEVE